MRLDDQLPACLGDPKQEVTQDLLWFGMKVKLGLFEQNEIAGLSDQAQHDNREYLRRTNANARQIPAVPGLLIDEIELEHSANWLQPKIARNPNFSSQ